MLRPAKNTFGAARSMVATYPLWLWGEGKKNQILAALETDFVPLPRECWVAGLILTVTIFFLSFFFLFVFIFCFLQKVFSV